MAVAEIFKKENPPVSIIATDVNPEALASALRGEYTELSVRGLDTARLEAHFQKSETSARWGIRPAPRRTIEFKVLNLVDAMWPVNGPFDGIFCRNVLMYLEARHRADILTRMSALLRTDGLLFLDPTKHLGGADSLFAATGEGVYVKKICRCPGRDNR
jgi:chemotaxis protein methyltransferase CheR